MHRGDRRQRRLAAESPRYSQGSRVADRQRGRSGFRRRKSSALWLDGESRGEWQCEIASFPRLTLCACSLLVGDGWLQRAKCAHIYLRRTDVSYVTVPKIQENKQRCEVSCYAL